MPLIAGGLEGWRLGRPSVGPFHVEEVGPYRLLQVCDERGHAALSGPGGAVFCASLEEAEALCRAANAGELERV